MIRFNLEYIQQHPEQLPALIKQIEKGTDAEAEELLFDWDFIGREKQHAPETLWFVWLVLAGRGFGKTLCGAQWVRKRIEREGARRIALVNDTAADVRDIMIEGVSGILAVSSPNFMPYYEPSKRRLTWPNGAIATGFAAESPEALRGPGIDSAWCDEPAKWRNLRKRDVEGGTAWANLMMALREGDDPRCVCTTTPRPIKWLKDLIARDSTFTTKGTSFENRTNLSPRWFEEVIEPYLKTRLGRQEVNAELLEETEGALWTLKQIEALRVNELPCELKRIVVGVDPSITSNERSAECGIVVAGLGTDGHGYILDDLSLVASPHVWASRVVLAHKKHEADRVVAETNQGGDMVELTLRTVDENIPIKKVHAAVGKRTRAEPVAALYEQGKIHHVGMFAALEDEMTTWVAGEESPNHLDAMVWAVTDLFNLHADARKSRVAFGVDTQQEET